MRRMSCSRSLGCGHARQPLQMKARAGGRSGGTPALRLLRGSWAPAGPRPASSWRPSAVPASRPEVPRPATRTTTCLVFLLELRQSWWSWPGILLRPGLPAQSAGAEMRSRRTSGQQGAAATAKQGRTARVLACHQAHGSRAPLAMRRSDLSTLALRITSCGLECPCACRFAQGTGQAALGRGSPCAGSRSRVRSAAAIRPSLTTSSIPRRGCAVTASTAVRGAVHRCNGHCRRQLAPNGANPASGAGAAGKHAFGRRHPSLAAPHG